MAQHIAPPFILSTHTHTVLPLLQDVVCELADVYKNQLLHVVDNEGDREVALQCLTDCTDTNHGNVDSDFIEDCCSYNNQGMMGALVS